LRGRWEVLSQNPLTICDTGHNGHGIRYVAEQLSSLIASSPNSLSPHRLHIILGMVNDKDIDTVLALLPIDAVYYFTQPATSRALPAEELLRRWQQLHPIANTQYPISAFSIVREALEAAKEAASAEDIIFIGGSNYVVGEALSVRL
jgi:dihydrofolate synthase/folylpolyglutamate synthase